MAPWTACGCGIQLCFTDKFFIARGICKDGAERFGLDSIANFFLDTFQYNKRKSCRLVVGSGRVS